MAIKDGIYGYVSGTVGRMFETKNGSAFVIEVKREGSEWPDRVTAWGPVIFQEGITVPSIGAPVAQSGDRVTVKGWISWRREVKDDKTFFNVSVNKPEVTEHEPAAGQRVEGDDSVPF